MSHLLSDTHEFCLYLVISWKPCKCSLPSSSSFPSIEVILFYITRKSLTILQKSLPDIYFFVYAVHTDFVFQQFASFSEKVFTSF